MRYCLLLSFVLSMGLGACSTYRDHLTRGQGLYEQNQYEYALAIWRVIEENVHTLSEPDRSQYMYFRGMTDYRLGYRSHARYWLGLAKANEQTHPGGLRPEWKKRADQALTDLNKEVFGQATFGGSESVTEHSQKQTDGVPAEPDPAEQPSGATQSGGGGFGLGASVGGSAKSCRSASECSSEQACVKRRCMTP